MAPGMLARFRARCRTYFGGFVFIVLCCAISLTAYERRKRRIDSARILEMKGHLHRPPEGRPLPASLRRRRPFGNANQDVSNSKMSDQPQSAFFQRLPAEIRDQVLEYVLPSTNHRRRIIINSIVPVTEEGFADATGYRRNSIIDRWRWPLYRTYCTFTELHPDDPPYSLYRHSTVPGILTACRRSHTESLAVLYSKITFIMDAPYRRARSLSDCIELLDGFGDRAAQTLIKHFSIRIPVVMKLHYCKKCAVQWEHLWRSLSALRGLRKLQITLETDFSVISDSKPHEKGWADRGIEWLGDQLLGLSKIDEVIVWFRKSLVWMIPALEVYVESSDIKFSLREAPPVGPLGILGLGTVE